MPNRGVLLLLPWPAGDRGAAAQRRWLEEPGHRDGCILHGPLLSDDGAGWAGSALLVQARDRAAVEAMLAGAPYVQAGLYTSVEIHDLAVRRAPPTLTRPALVLQVPVGQPR
jgi:uncharacterized protein YciI